MEIILSWVKQIFAISIFSGILIHLVPSGKYQQYVRFVCSVILTIVCINPVITLVSGSKNDEAVLRHFMQISQMEELRSEIGLSFDGDEKNNIAEYENAVVSYIESRVLEQGLYPLESQVVIDWDEASASYGTLQQITLYVADSKEQSGNIDINIAPINADASDSKYYSGKDSVKVSALKSELALYYGINASNVNIYNKTGGQG